MRFSEICIRRPVMTTLVMASLLLAGFFGYRQLPIAAIPRIEVPTITVTTQYPGASAGTMAISVAAPLERQFATIAGITSITSNNTEGNTQITLEFDLNRNIDAAALDVQSAISVALARLPEDLPTPPAYRRVNPADSPIIFLALTSETATSQEMNEFADKVMSPRLSTITGVAQVNIYGAQKRAVRIKYDFNALASRGISVEEIRQTVLEQASVKPVGSIRTQQQIYIIEVKGAEPTAAFFKPLIVAWRNGTPVRLEDVATVEDLVENIEARAEFNGQRSIIVNVQRQPDANTVAVIDTVRKMIPEFQRLLPPTVRLEVLSDRSESIRASVHDVQITLILTAVLVILVILAFLRTWRATFIPAIALPLSIIGTFAGMALMGFSLDNVSLLALTLALGFVVDDAIVVLENIVRYVEQGMRPFEAAIRGASEIGFTVVSITVSLVAVFIPILFMGGIVGRFFFEFAMTISMAILLSGFISLTLTPMLASRMLKTHRAGEARPGLLSRAFEGAYNLMALAYRVTLDASLRVPSLMLIVTVGTIVATVWAFGVVKKGFLPTEDTSIIIVRTEAAPDIAFQAMLDRQRVVSERIRTDPDVLYVNSNVQQTPFNPTLNRGSIFVQLKLRRDRVGKATISEVQNRLRRSLAGIPGIRAFPVPLQNLRIGSRSGAALYQYTLTSVDQAEPLRQRAAPHRSRQGGAGLRRRDERPDARRAAAQARRRPRRAGPLRPQHGRAALDPLFRVRHAQDRHRLYAVERLRGHPRGGQGADARPRRPVQSHHPQQCRPADKARLRGHGQPGARPGLGRAPEPAAGGHRHLQPGARLHAGRGGARHARDRARCEDAAHHHRPVRRHRAGVRELVPRPAAPDSGRHPHRLHRAGHSLRELHSSDHDPVRAAVGEPRRAPGPVDVRY